MSVTPSATDNGAALPTPARPPFVKTYPRLLYRYSRQALTLGQYSTDALDALTVEYYANDPRARVGHGIGEHGLQQWETHALDAHFGDTRRVLVAAAGDGREIQALMERGIDTLGFDPCPDLVSRAASRLGTSGGDNRLIRSRPSRVPDIFMEDTFDGAVVGWAGYTHIIGAATRIAFLRQIRDLLPPGAPLLLSFFTRSGSPRRFRYVSRLANFVRRINGLEASVEPGDMFDGSFDHHFTENGIARELEAGGFRQVFFNARPYGHAVGVAR